MLVLFFSLAASTAVVPKRSRKKRIALGVGGVLLAAAAFGGAIIASDDGGLYDSSTLLSNHCADGAGRFGNGLCEAYFTINSTSDHVFSSNDVIVSFDYLDGKPTNIKLNYEVGHYEKRNITVSEPTVCASLGIGKNGTETFDQNDCHIQPIIQEQDVFISNGMKLLTGQNVIHVWTYDKPSNVIADWNVQIINVPVKVLGIEKGYDYTTKQKGWAVFPAMANSSIIGYFTFDDQDTDSNATNGLSINKVNVTNATRPSNSSVVTGFQNKAILNDSYNFTTTAGSMVEVRPSSTDLLNFSRYGAATLSAWIRLDTISVGTPTIIYWGAFGTSDIFYISTNTGKFTCAVRNSANTRVIVTGTTSYVANALYMETCVYNGTHVSIYTNGTFEAKSAQSGTIRNDPNINLSIGGDNNALEYTTGLMDEVFALNTSLNDSQVSDVFQQCYANASNDIKGFDCLMYGTPRNATLGIPVSWSFNESNQSANHNVTFYRDFNATNSSVCVVLNYTTNNTNFPMADYVNGILNFTRNVSKTGNYSLKVTVQDNCSNFVTQTFQLNITNTVPTIIANWSTSFGYDTVDLLAYCNATDLDNDDINVSWQVRANTTVLSANTINASGRVNVYNTTAHIGSNYTINCSANDTVGFSGFTNSNITQIISPLNASNNFTVYFAINLSSLNFSASNLSSFRYNATNVSAYGQTVALPCYMLINNAPFTLTVNASLNSSNSSFDFGISNSTNLTGANFSILNVTTKNITLLPANSNLSIYCYGTYRDIRLGQRFNNTVAWTIGGS